MITRPSLLLPLIALALLLGSASVAAANAQRDAAGFILETLNKKQGDGWSHVGQNLLGSYRFDHANCLLSVQRKAEFDDTCQPRIPLATVVPVGSQNSEIVFDCCQGDAGIGYNIKNLRLTDEQQLARTRLLVMDSPDITALMNAFAELASALPRPFRARAHPLTRSTPC